MPTADERANLNGSLHSEETFCFSACKPASSVVEKSARKNCMEKHYYRNGISELDGFQSVPYYTTYRDYSGGVHKVCW